MTKAGSSCAVSARRSTPTRSRSPAPSRVTVLSRSCAGACRAAKMPRWKSSACSSRKNNFKLVQALLAAHRLVHERNIIGDRRIFRVLRLRFDELVARLAQIAAQQERIADIVEHFRARAVDRKRFPVGAVRQIVAAQPV